jgi:hypothetical protein
MTDKTKAPTRDKRSKERAESAYPRPAKAAITTSSVEGCRGVGVVCGAKGCGVTSVCGFLF